VGGMEIRCREEIIMITGMNANRWEYFYPHELDKLDRLDRVWAERVKEFHKEYYRGEFDVPLAYIVFYDNDDNIVSVIAVSLFVNEFNPTTPEITFTDVDEWLRSRDDP
jgi:hypothetical protein